MNALIDMAEARYEEFFGSDKHFGKLPESKEEFIQTSIQKISFTMNDPMIRKMRKFLVREQFRSERFAEITTKHQLNGIQGMYTKIIEGSKEERVGLKRNVRGDKNDSRDQLAERDNTSQNTVQPHSAVLYALVAAVLFALYSRRIIRYLRRIDRTENEYLNPIRRKARYPCRYRFCRSYIDKAPADP